MKSIEITITKDGGLWIHTKVDGYTRSSLMSEYDGTLEDLICALEDSLDYELKWLKKEEK